MELVVAEAAIQRRPSPLVDVFVKVRERDLQARIKAAGGRWHKHEGVWRIRRAIAVALGLRSQSCADPRIHGWFRPRHIRRRYPAVVAHPNTAVTGF